MLTFITANTFTNIIAAAQSNEMGYQTSGAANAVISILAFRKFFVCGVKLGAPAMYISDFARFEKDTQTDLLKIFAFSNITRYRMANIERRVKVQHSMMLASPENTDSLKVLLTLYYSTRPNATKT